MISEDEKLYILKEFPNIELSYETILHKKVYNSDFILAIPDGKKCFAWFTIFKNQNVCIILEISENKKICNLEIMKTCFHAKLSFGTIFYGTIIKCNKLKFFSTEDIYYYKGKDVSKKTYLEKLDLFSIIYSSEIKQVSYNENNIVFGVPIISSTFTQEIQNAIEMLPYNIKYIMHCKNNEVKYIPYSIQISVNMNTIMNKLINKEIIFKIKADIQVDIYNLYTNTSDSIYDIAYIPDYKTSIIMNTLFRNIKENRNLDAIEESDDEEFEDDNPNKFVFLDKEYNMVCAFNSRFKKWTPIRLAQKHEKVVSKHELFSLEK